MLSITNEDNMQLMARYPDKFFDLAIVDPPYGNCNGTKTNLHKCKHGILAKQAKIEHIPHRRTEDSKAYSWAKKYSLNKIVDWDIAPSEEYFKELFRVSKNQIIWGGNYFDLPQSRNFIVWEKQTISENFSMAMAEYAWASIEGNSKIIKYPPQNPERFHPTQKPVYLYKKLLQWYSKPDYKILDTHLGSGSIALACIDFKLDLVACEIDIDYFNVAIKRIEDYQKQKELF
ncbi:MAG: site-specific DNA-methyltransferase [Termitinemataceae bacterium]|nr:MAG: site-specific DNA-methyltransferase [Termitinemataceae bacterium]